MKPVLGEAQVLERGVNIEPCEKSGKQLNAGPSLPQNTLSERGGSCWDMPQPDGFPESSESDQSAAWLHLSKIPDYTYESLVTESRVWDRWGPKSGMAEGPQLLGT